MEEKNYAMTCGIPFLQVKGVSLPDTWEKSIVELWEKGCNIPTQYDKKGDPLSRDATLAMVVLDPFSEPRIHRDLPTGLEELEIYRQEVVLGIHDHWVGEKGWSYSYHDRLFKYPGSKEFINQVDNIVRLLTEDSCSRRTIASTWVPEIDCFHHEPPCLQNIWCRISEENGELLLNMNTQWRSRDAYKAAFMNMFALTDLQRVIAELISGKIGRKVKIGRYVDISNSYHIYGSYFKEIDRILNGIKNRSFEDRTYTTKFAEPFFEETREKLSKNPDFMRPNK